ncbi:MAG: hypothetical protein F4Z44_00815 [Gemmatimonadetes bacterium]|nr:hypothetical protein [Gemmatimonadota bacterium]
MIARVCNTVPAVFMLPLLLGPLAGVAGAQEETAKDFQPVRFRFYLVQADGFTEQDPEIADVVNELRKLFTFRGYRLVATPVVNTVLEWSVSGRWEGFGTQRIVVGDSETPWELSVDVRSAPSSPTIRVEVTLTSIVPWSIRENARRDPVEVYLEASVTIRDGQTVVLGSTRTSAEEPVLILVLTPEFDPA